MLTNYRAEGQSFFFSKKKSRERVDVGERGGSFPDAYSLDSVVNVPSILNGP